MKAALVIVFIAVAFIRIALSSPESDETGSDNQETEETEGTEKAPKCRISGLVCNSLQPGHCCSGCQCKLNWWKPISWIGKLLADGHCEKTGADECTVPQHVVRKTVKEVRKTVKEGSKRLKNVLTTGISKNGKKQPKKTLAVTNDKGKANKRLGAAPVHNHEEGHVGGMEIVPVSDY